jgi:prolyl 4-hydroxylase
MWDANYFGQEHTVLSEQSHFVTMPSAKDGTGQKEIWRRLDYADYDTKKEQGQEDVLNLKKYRKQEPLELTLKVVSVAPRVFEIDGFLSDVEVEHLLDMASIYNITKSNGEEKKKSTNRITNAWIKREMSPIVDAIYHRSADIMKIDESFLRHRNEYEQTEINTHHSIAETMRLTQYVESQGYMPRSDATQPPVRNRYQPHRFATVVFFLNDVVGESGGDTVFPLAVNEKNHDGIRVVPKRGKALLFYNMLPDGNVDDLSQHSSEFVQDGEKWLGTLFVWDPIIN